MGDCDHSVHSSMLRAGERMERQQDDDGAPCVWHVVQAASAETVGEPRSVRMRSGLDQPLVGHHGATGWSADLLA